MSLVLFFDFISSRYSETVIPSKTAKNSIPPIAKIFFLAAYSLINTDRLNLLKKGMLCRKLLMREMPLLTTLIMQKMLI